MQIIEEKKIEKVEHLEGDEYIDCTFVSCVFSPKALQGKRFQSCLFTQCSFVATRLEMTRMQDVSFVESKLMGIDFTVCDPSFLGIGFTECVLGGCNFSGMKMKRARLLKCVVKECHFQESQLQEAQFKESDLEGTIFHHTRLEKADFRLASQYRIDPLNNSIQGAKFSSPEALSLLEELGIKIE